jgi:hypothetical protein
MDELIDGWTVSCDLLGSQPEIRYPYSSPSSFFSVSPGKCLNRFFSLLPSKQTTHHFLLLNRFHTFSALGTASLK